MLIVSGLARVSCLVSESWMSVWFVSCAYAPMHSNAFGIALRMWTRFDELGSKGVYGLYWPGSSLRGAF